MNPAGAIAEQAAVFADQVDHLMLTLVALALIAGACIVIGLGRLLLTAIAETRQAAQDEAQGLKHGRGG
jgi:hypothetical protein